MAVFTRIAFALVSLMMLAITNAFKSYGDDGAPNYTLIQDNDQGCCGGGGAYTSQRSAFNWWATCQAGGVVRKICLHMCSGTTLVCRNSADRLTGRTCEHKVNYPNGKRVCDLDSAMAGIQVWWTDNQTDLFSTRYETAGTLWPGADASGAGSYLNEGDKNYIQCAEFEVSNNERITRAEIKSGDQIDFVKIETSNPSNNKANGAAMYHGNSVNGVSHVWKNGDANIARNYYLGSGLLCGLSGQVHGNPEGPTWLWSLRFNFLKEIKLATMTEITWTAPFDSDPAGNSLLDEHVGGEYQCDANLQTVRTDGFEYTTQQTSTVQYETTSTWGWKAGSSFNVKGSHEGTASIAKLKTEMSLTITSEFSGGSTKKNQTTTQNQKTTKRTFTKPWQCPVFPYTNADGSGTASLPAMCDFNFRHHFSAKWQDSPWTATMVYNLKEGGQISFPVSGSITGEMYDDFVTQIPTKCTSLTTSTKAGVRLPPPEDPSMVKPQLIMKYPVTYVASLDGPSVIPSLAPSSSQSTGHVSITIKNVSYASGYFYATNINQMKTANLAAGAVGKNGPVIARAFDATYGPISGSIKASFTFDPSINNVTSLLADAAAYFSIQTVANPAGELRGQV